MPAGAGDTLCEIHGGKRRPLVGFNNMFFSGYYNFRQ